MSDRNEWFKDVKRLVQGLEVETVEDPFAWPSVTSVTDGEDVLHALGLHPSRDACGIVNVDIDEVHELIRHIEPEPVTGSTSDGYHTFDELYHHRAVLFSVIVANDPWYYDEDDEEVECPECKRTFELEIATVRTYRTKRRIEDMPDGWNGGELL